MCTLGKELTVPPVHGDVVKCVWVSMAALEVAGSIRLH